MRPICISAKIIPVILNCIIILFKQNLREKFKNLGDLCLTVRNPVKILELD